MDPKEIRFLELKVCERCGGLWLRPAREGGIYCRRCHASMQAMPTPAVRGRKKRSQSAAAAPALEAATVAGGQA